MLIGRHIRGQFYLNLNSNTAYTKRVSLVQLPGLSHLLRGVVSNILARILMMICSQGTKMDTLNDPSLITSDVYCNAMISLFYDRTWLCYKGWL